MKEDNLKLRLQIERIKMRIKSVFDDSFKKYGQVLKGYNFTEMFQVMPDLEMPEQGYIYVADVHELETCEVYEQIFQEGFGSMPIQIGVCMGRNDRLNCLEYHKSSEFNIAKDDVILMLGLQYDIQDGKYETSKVEMFHVPAETGVELYATTLHYAPCGYEGKQFQVICVLPEGTNVGKPDIPYTRTFEGKWCFGRNKWVLAHPDSDEGKAGAYIGLSGENLKYCF